ncbi:MAG: beta-ketoacyl synthase chain length factor [Succinivibrionaceae bacterium]
MFKITIEGAGFLSDRTDSLTSFKQLDFDKYFEMPLIDVKDFSIIKNIPMMLRRRLNNAGKMAIGLSLNLINNSSYNIGKVIYASRVGESLRCVQLLNEMVLDKGVSPTEFSASVHNSNVGVFSIAKKYHCETTAIAAGNRTFYSGLVDVYCSLKTQNIEHVLLVVYEESLATPKMDVINNDSFGGSFALALVLSNNCGKKNIDIEEYKDVRALEFAYSEDLQDSIKVD